MPIKISGLISGMDTDSMVKELVSSYRIKTQKYEKAKTKLEWKQDAWKELNSKIYNLYSTTLSNLRGSGAYNQKKTIVSDQTKATVVAKASAVSGTQSLEIRQLAKAGYLTGEKLNTAEKITSGSKLSELGITTNSKITLTKGGEATDIELTPDMTVKDFMNKLGETGVTVNFDESNQRFFVNSKSSGAAENFELQATGEGYDALTKMGLAQGQEVTGGNLTLASGALINNNTKLAELGLTVGTKFQVKGIDGTTKDIDITQDTTVENFVEELKGAGINASFNSETQSFYMNIPSGVSLEGNQTELAKLKLSDNTIAESKAIGGKKIEGVDSIIILNEAEFRSATSNFSINGLTITANAVTEAGAPLTLTTNTDVDAIYDTIKGFLTEYNSLIKEMDTLYNASSAKGYEPLTSEEKEAMSDEDVEKWEKKIKDSLLRRDGTLSTVISGMKTSMQSSVEINGKKYTLSSFGINTGGYFTSGDNEKGIYHIDGDSEDSSTKNKDDKLRAMIASDPETVSTFFSTLFTNVYDDLTKKMARTELSSIYTVYNDKQLANEKKDYEKKIDKWEDYVAQQEKYWYSKFTAMESALSKLQSSTSALSGLLGS